MADTFKMKDGRKVTVDFTDLKSITSVKKKDWKEIKKQLDEWLEIVCSQLTGDEVFKLMKNRA